MRVNRIWLIKFFLLLILASVILSRNTLLAVHRSAPVLTASYTKTDPQYPESSYWRTVPGVTISIDVTPDGGHGHAITPDEWIGNIDEGASTVVTKVAYNKAYLYMYFRWADDDADRQNDFWEYTSQWDFNDIEQDRLYLEWPIKDALGEYGDRHNIYYARAGCAKTCHRVYAFGANKNASYLTEGPINNCGGCHKAARKVAYDFQHYWIPTDIQCSGCHANRSFNPISFKTTVAADHSAPPNGLYDMWSWNAALGWVGSVAEDQYIPGNKRRRSDTSSSPWLENSNSSLTYPKKIWHPTTELGLEKPLTKNIYEKYLTTVSTDEPGTIIDGTEIPYETRISSVYLNDLKARGQDVLAKSKWSNGYWEVVLKRRLKTGYVNDYSFLDAKGSIRKGPHYFGLAITDAEKRIHAGRNINKLYFK